MRTNGVRPIGLMAVRAIAVGLAIVGGLASMARPAHAADSVQLGFIQTLGDSAVELFIDNVSAGTLGPSEGVLLDIEEGEHTLAVRSVDDDTATEELANVDLEVDVDIEVGDPQLLVAHFDEAGEEAVLTVTDAPIPSGSDPECVAVFHAASAPAVDVFVDEALVRRNLSNGSLSPQLPLDESAATVSLTPSGSGVVAAGPLDFTIDANTCDLLVVTGDPASSLEVSKALSFSLLPENAWGDLLGDSELVLLNATDTPADVEGDDIDAESLEPLGGVVSLPVDAGRYSVDFGVGSETVGGTASALGGSSVTMVVHYDAEQSITTSAFVDDGQRLPAGRACVDFRHTAGAPAVDVYVDDAPISEAVESGQSTGRSQVKPGTRTVVLTPVGSSAPVVDPITVTVREGQCVLLHLIGTVTTGDSLDVVGLELNGIQSVPNAVPSGNSPLPTAERTLPLPLFLAGAMITAGLVAGIGIRRRVGRQPADLR